jgi:hypothetical protein
MDIGTAKAAVDLLNIARKAVKNLSERGQASKDSAIKKSIGDLQDTFNSLREAISRLTEENAELRRAQIEPKPSIRQVGETNYYFVGEEGPYCQPCYHRISKLVPLSPREQNTSGSSRQCPVCYATFWEQRQSAGPIRRRRYGSR